MAIKAADQISIVDLTDAYSVILTSEAYTFPGTTNAAKAGSCSTQVIALCGSETVNATVDLSKLTLPDEDGITVTKDTNVTSPTLTITVNSSFNKPGDIVIPISIDNGKVTINKRFSLSIAFTGATGQTGAAGKGVKDTIITYQVGTSGTTAPTGSWQATIPSVSAGQYLWTKTAITYTDNSTSTAYSVGMMGATGAAGAAGTAGKGVKSTTITYQVGSSGTTAPTGTWGTTIPAVAAGKYLWTKTVITYTDNTNSTSYSVGMMGATGATGADGPQGEKGEDAITMAVTSSNGTIFKNSAIETVLTAHVYKAGVEVTDTAAIAALGTIKWYKDGSSTAASTGRTLTVSAGNVTNKATYIAQLE